ncbi:ergothioneine biosynthesis protein EgtB [Methylophaga sp.]|uniref:ergothioneine biosynthesis protein EgtB n=1 Tax=Methylophaga sp. TaxID=2024840 RepID=UPI0013FF74B9|nr:ergothioneine biosynthesis protein EgtB [Methylophaga sp.]MTI63527.1 ergothioneine biosynthesis protein EgtB [Methylophaga sp.]
MNIQTDALNTNAGRAEHSLSRAYTLSERYQQVRDHSLILCAPLQTEDFVVQPHAEVSPPKWHLAHTTWFFEQAILKQFSQGYQVFSEDYSRLFNSYYKSAGEHWLQSERGQLSRPTVDEIYNYRRTVDKCLLHLLDEEISNSEMLEVLELGLNHEQQHQELLLMDIKRILATNLSMPAYTEAHWSAPEVAEHWTEFPEGIYEIGHEGDSFAYDNETPRHKQYLHRFSLRDNTVSCGEFIEFIDAGGYSNPGLWLSQGWDWVRHNQITAPFYWFKKDGIWHQYTLHGVKPVPAHEPVVHVSYFEADAFARWKGCRLPVEAELELWLEEQPEMLSPRTALLHPNRAEQAINQVWYWTASHYSPYPGYQPYSGMLGEYNGKFMCNQFVLRGGCVATPAGHYRASYRNFYQPEQRWMFSGIKLAKHH